MNTLDLRATRRDLAAQARDKIDEIKDDTPQERASTIEAEFDDLMREFDMVGRQIRASELDQLDDRSLAAMGSDTSTPAVDYGHSAANELKPFAARHGQSIKRFAKAKDHSSEEYKGLELGDYLRSMVIGAKTDIEKRALAEGTDSAGGYTVPEILSQQMIDLLRAESVVSRAGALTMPLSSKDNVIAKLLSDPVPGWRAENSTIPESDATFGPVTLQPKALAVLCKVSWELMSDSVNIGTDLPRIMTTAMAKELDRVALLGSGTGEEPEGLINVSGIGTTPHDAALANFAPFITARTGIKTANAGPVSAYIMHPRDEGTLAGLTATDNQPLMAPKVVSDIPMLTTTAIPVDGGGGSDESTIFAGNFSNMIIGIRDDIRIVNAGNLNAANGQHTLIAWLRADIAVRHAESFHTITGVQG